MAEVTPLYLLAPAAVRIGVRVFQSELLFLFFILNFIVFNSAKLEGYQENC